MAIVLSIVNVLLALVFVFAGATKAFQPMDKLAPKMPWVSQYSTRTVRLIGWAEFLGGLGLVLPGVVGLDVLQLAATLGLALVMGAAVVWHLRHKDYKGTIPSAVLLVLLIVLALFMVL